MLLKDQIRRMRERQNLTINSSKQAVDSAADKVDFTHIFICFIEKRVTCIVGELEGTFQYTVTINTQAVNSRTIFRARGLVCLGHDKKLNFICAF